jgi:hypothetical protein
MRSSRSTTSGRARPSSTNSKPTGSDDRSEGDGPSAAYLWARLKTHADSGAPRYRGEAERPDDD